MKKKLKNMTPKVKIREIIVKEKDKKDKER